MIRNNFAHITNYLCRESIKNLNRHLTESELKNFSNNDYYYLTTIYYLGKPNFSQIAKELGVTKPAVSVLVRKLIKMDLIEKVQSQNDKRIHYVSVTEKGKRIVDGDEALYSYISTLIKASIKSDEEYQLVEKILTDIVAKLK